MPTGTNGNDVLFFQGTLGNLVMSITNPYTGEVILLNDIYNINTTTYDGLNGNDTLLMTDFGDALFLDGTSGTQTVRNIESFFAGDGGDALILSSATHTLGNITIDGGLGNDVLWANNGNDRVNGSDGDDNINGGGGNDFLNGGNDNDTINGASGADLLNGEAGMDRLMYSVDAGWGSGFGLSVNGGLIAVGSGATSFVFNGSQSASYDTFSGGDGIDFVIGTSGNDVLVLDDALSIRHPSSSGARVTSVEEMDMGGGHDVVDLLSANYAYGDVILRGESGNDWLRSGSGNDTLYGGTGNDYLVGGAGNDVIYGGNHDALITIDKDFADDITFPGLIEGTNLVNLLPPGDPSLGIADGNLDIGFDSTATITFRQGFAGYNNTLGVYAIAADGTIQSASILWANVKTAGINVAHTVDLPTDATHAQLGFFIIADGDNVNNHYSGLNITGNGVVSFIYDFGQVTQRAANVADDAGHISIVYNDGVTTQVLGGYDYHTTGRGDDPSLNWDDKTHVVSGLASVGNDDVLRIGFEDLPCTGDADYEDVLFDFNVNPGYTDPSEVGNDVLIGGAGNDTLYGEAGNDILVVGLGADQIYGGSGNDIIAYDVLDTLVDTIFGFETGTGHDTLNLAALLQGFDSGDNINDFVHLASVSGGTEVRVNADGDVGGAFTTIALIAGGVGGASLADLVGHGNLVVDTPVSV